jgi:hypothetical protein
MNSISAVTVAILAGLMLGWASRSLRETPVRIVPAPVNARSTEQAEAPKPLPKSEALDTLSTVSRAELDKALFLRSFASSR